VEKFCEQIDRNGYSIVHDVLSEKHIERAKQELERAIESEVKIHGNSDYIDYGMVIVCSLYGWSFIELFDNRRLIEPFETILGDGCIVYAYTSSSMPPHGNNFSCRVHVDCPRLIPGYITNIGATILLDDFTEENGGTWFLPGSHKMAEPPTEEHFFRNAERLIAPAGSVFYFNARLWHSGGKNITSEWRHALTINMARPWMKQRLDIPRMMQHMDLSNASETALQKLGFHSRVPASYDEYYAPKDERCFRQRTE